MDALREIAKTAGVAMDVALVALFGALLGRLAGQSACALPLLRASGVQPEWDGVVGPASEEIAVRVDATDDTSLRKLFERGGGAVAIASGRVPLARVFERAAIDPASVAARVVVVPFVAPSGTGAIAAPAVVPAAPSLDLVATIGRDAVALRLVHDGRVLDREQLAVIAEQFVALVTLAVAMPERAMGEHSLVTAGTRAVLPDPTSAITHPPQEPIVDTILRQAAARPDDVAIARGDVCITYRQLADASQRLARALRAAGVDRGGVVAVTGDLSPGYIVAMLAVLRSRAALLAIDPRVTPTRRSLMAQESRAVAVVCVGTDPLAGMPSLRFAISADTGALETEFDDRTPLPAIGADDPAFVVFTSGTTGVPKAALWPHAGVAHFVKWQRETFEVGPADRAAQLANLSFAVATRDVFMPLTAGAMLLLPPHDWVYMGANATDGMGCPRTDHGDAAGAFAAALVARRHRAASPVRGARRLLRERAARQRSRAGHPRRVRKWLPDRQPFRGHRALPGEGAFRSPARAGAAAAAGGLGRARHAGADHPRRPDAGGRRRARRNRRAQSVHCARLPQRAGRSRLSAQSVSRRSG
jgi:non-ribosomal peptide synthetase component F